MRSNAMCIVKQEAGSDPRITVFALQRRDLWYNNYMRRSIFRIGEMSATEKTFFIVSFAGMFFAFIFDFTGFLEKKFSRIFFSVFLGMFIINWLVVLIKYRRKGNKE